MDAETVELVETKLDQAESRLEALDIDCWLTFARETSEIPEPALALILGAGVVWESAFLVTASGDHHAIVGRYDADPVEAVGRYEVHTYDESIRDPLRDTLEALDPERIAVNYAENEQVADGLTHGMYRRLCSLLEGTDYPGRFESSAPVMGYLRHSLTDLERTRMKRAAELTEELLAEAVEAWEPDWTEARFADFLHDRMREDGLESAWSWDGCPAVDAGSAAPVGHTHPGDRTVPPGEVLHVDFGVRYEGYASDIQRLYYRSHEDEAPPADLQAAFDDVRAAIEAGKAVLEPGVVGHEVDAAVRTAITDRGWPAFEHAAGHTVGRNAHDAGPLLGPRWDRYGDRPERTVSVGEVYTLELGVETEWGYLGQEELLEVTDQGARYFLPPQTALRTLE